MSKAELKLGGGFSFTELFEIDGLKKLDDQFLARLRAHNHQLHDKLLRYREGNALPPIDLSELLLGCAPILEEQIADLFGIHEALRIAQRAARAHDPVFTFKKQFVLRRAKRRLQKKEELEDFATLDSWLAATLKNAGSDTADRELAVAHFAEQLLRDEPAHSDAIEKLTRWCLRALTTPEGIHAVRDWVSFRIPHTIDPAHLVPIKVIVGDPIGRFEGPPENRRRRDGFDLTDTRMSPRAAMNEVHYCIYCHDHDGDFCSKGFPEKKGEPERGLKVNTLGVVLTGCPLDEKISEMHVMKREGRTIAALAMITIDNPMCAATGHRICNDCMKGCIYQKQEPVNIPQTETRILTDVLDLSWGVEIYDLLIRWNPLRARQWLPKPYNGLKVLIMGLGPAGFTLAHHLLMEGFAVVGVDGLKIEPLPRQLIDAPIPAYRDLTEDLAERVMTGFGGVAEYGITNRWDKNFLKLIYLSLSRRPRLQIFGGVRFGGTVTVEDAWRLGFDHLAIAVGAGLPQALPIPGSLAPGMRQANDFLMALQLTGAAKSQSLANLQVRLPAVVIGGGLTGIDTATEVQAYYIAQVEKTLARHEALAAAVGEAKILTVLDEVSARVLAEFLEHGRAVRAERARAKAASEVPDFLPLIRQWGGVTVAYRRAMNESPAYTRNHEEITKAFEEGILYAEGLDPKSTRRDQYGQVEGLVCRRQIRTADGHWEHTEEEIVLAARSIFVATGARPNVAYEFEHRGHFSKEHGHYKTHQRVDGALAPVPVAAHCKLPDFGPFTSYRQKDRRVSFIGDTHPVFHGSVVKAIASALRVYPEIVAALGERARARGDDGEYQRFQALMADMFVTRVQTVERLSPTAIEVRVRAPMAANKFRPGQFFRLQNFETHSPLRHGTRLQTEALALSGSSTDPDAGVISLIIIEQGASSRLCARLKPGEPVTLMGPTGVRTKIPDGGETIMIIGGTLGAAYVLAVGPALRAKHNRVLYVAALDSADELFVQDRLEQAADTIVWCTASGNPVKPRRPGDRSASGDLIEVIQRYARGHLEPTRGKAPIMLEDVTRLLITGSNRLVRRVRAARNGELRGFFVRDPVTLASISTPMQCMLKGVCAQCLQWQIDPETGHRTKAVFSCSWQDQPLDIVDLDNLDERLSQNRLQEHLNDMWLDYILHQSTDARV